MALLEDEDFDTAEGLAQAALAEAPDMDAQMAAREVLATLSYLTDETQRGIAVLTDFDARSVAAYGWRDPRRIVTLDRLMVLYQETNDTTAARDAALQQTHLIRGAPDNAADLPLALITLARLELIVGDPQAAALMAIEAAFLAIEAEGLESPQVADAVLLHAQAHLHLGDPARALAWADVSEQTTGPAWQAFDAALTGYIKQNGIDADMMQDVRAEAAQLSLFDALSIAQTQGASFWDSLAQGDLDVAAEVAENIRTAAHPTDVTPLPFCEALAVGLPEPMIERTIPWLECLSAYPPAYLATRADLVAPIRRAEAWLVQNAQQHRALPLLHTARAVTTLLQGDDSYDALGLMGLEADALFSARDFTRTGEVLAQMRAAPTLSQNPDLQFQAMILQGELHTALNQPDEAEAMFQATAALFDAGTLPRDNRWTTVLDFMAKARVTLGDLQGAIAFFDQALAHEAKLGDAYSRRAMFVRLNLAATLTRAGNHKKAVQLFEAARSLVENNAAVDPNLTAAWQLLYAETLEAAGQPDAENALRAQASLGGDGTQDPNARMVLASTQAGLAWTAGDLDGAQKFADQALTLMAPDDPDLAQVLLIKARVAARRGDDVGALDLLRRLAHEARKPGRGRVAELRETLPLYVEVAIRLAQQTPDPTSTRYLAEGFEVAQEYKSLTAGAAVARAAARWQSSPALAAKLRQMQDIEAAVEGLNTRYRAALSAGQDHAEVSQDLAASIQTHDALKAQIATEFSEYDQLFGPSTISPTAIASQLAPDEVLLLFVTSDDDNGRGVASSTIMGLTRETIMSGGTLTRTELEALATRLRCQAALTDPNCASGMAGTRGSFALGGAEEGARGAPPFDLALAHQAYQALLAPMEPILKGKSRLIIVPDPSLVSVPFHTLVRSAPTPETTLRTADWLIRDVTLFVVPTVAALSALRNQPAAASQGRFLGVGDPLIGRQVAGPVPYDCGQTPVLIAALQTDDTPPDLRGDTGGAHAVAGLAALPDTRCELRAAAAYFGADSTLLLHADATESRIKALNRSGALAGYQTISFATHGLIAGELGANEAGIVLTPPTTATAEDDGLLSTSDIAQLTLNADMVLLSACNTAAGSSDSDEGLSGLASAFFYAGARSILVSHWPVYSDAATRLTTGTLARRKADQTLGYADALRLTMLSVLDDPASDERQLHPAYWAPFMVVGEGAARP
jgi:CHAT domain-containing protein/tetratricopeptide (TPR) repeat protein